jgi:hypothetical protein
MVLPLKHHFVADRLPFPDTVYAAFYAMVKCTLFIFIGLKSHDACAAKD